MLDISKNAATAIRSLLARPGVPRGCGLRVQPASDPRWLQIMLVTKPEPGDQIFAEGQLFVAREVAGRVRDKTLKARRSEAGRVQFVVDGPR